jgi:hypothetical protein
MYGRQVVVVTLYNEANEPTGEITIVEALNRQAKGEYQITNSAEVLAHMVLKLGVGA